MSDKQLQFKMTRRRAIGALVTIGAGGAATGAGTFAAFSDTETSTSNSVTAGTLDLTLGAAGSQTTTFSVGDVAPGETGYVVCALENGGNVSGELELKIGADDGADYAEFNTDDLKENSDGTNTEPELSADDDLDAIGDNGTGELASNLSVDAFVVDSDDGGTLSTGVASGTSRYYPDSDIDTQALVGGTSSGNSTSGDDLPGTYLGSWTLNGGETDYLVINYELPSTTGNVVQGDKLAFDIAFKLTQST